MITTPAGTIREVPALRTVSTKTFEMPGGIKHIRASLRREHHDAEGPMRDVDYGWRLLGDGTYGVRDAPFQVQCRPDEIIYRFTDRKTRAVVDVRLARIGGMAVAALGMTFNPEIRGCELWWPSVLPGVDVYFNSIGGISPHILLHDASVPRTFDWEITKEIGSPIQIVLDNVRGQDNYLSADVAERTTSKDRSRALEFSPIVVSQLGDTATHTRMGQSIEWTGRVAQVAPVTRIKSWTEEVVYPVRISS